MLRKIICIECPEGCSVTVDMEGGRAVRISGFKCPRGEEYAREEAENPVRVITSTVAAEGLSLKMVPVKTDRPVPKSRIFVVMKEISRIKLTSPVELGDILVSDLAGTGAALVATRSVSRQLPGACHGHVLPQ